MKNVNNHWRELDSEELPQGHEERFDKRLESAFGEPKRRFSFLQIAAAVLVLVSLAGLWVFQMDAPMTQTAEEEVGGEEVQMKEVEMYYQQSLHSQLSLIAKANEGPEAKAMIVDSEQMIAELDSAYQKLEIELNETGDQRVAAAMINNYKSRIQVLETLIQKINYVNELKKQNHESKAS